MKVFLVAFGLVWASSAYAGDAFDKHTSDVLEKFVAAAKPVKSLSLMDAVKLKTLAPRVSSPCVVVKTNDGNLAKALLAWGFRRGPQGPVPVLLIERFVTYRSDREDAAIASGRDVMLFAGLSFNFDIGQVVPTGQGGDVRFTDKSVLEPVDRGQLFGMNGSQAPSSTEKKHDPTDHDGVLPRDFSGTWRLNVDGRWRGELELKVGTNGRASGRYTSAESKSGYAVSGRVARLAHHIKLQIQLDNAVQSMDAYLWTSDKSAMAGVASLAGRSFGFYALRVEK